MPSLLYSVHPQLSSDTFSAERNDDQERGYESVEARLENLCSKQTSLEVAMQRVEASIVSLIERVTKLEEKSTMYPKKSIPTLAAGSMASAGDAAACTTDITADIATGADKVLSKGDTQIFECSEDDIDHYTLQPSVWDATFLIMFHHGAGNVYNRFDVFVTAVLYILNLVIVILMCLLVYINMSTQAWIDDDALHDLLNFRVMVSQGMDHYHPGSNTSLATRVCASDGSMVIASDQTGTHDDIGEYMTEHEPFNGPSLLMCALCIWFLSIGREVQGVVEFTYAVFSVKHSHRTEGTWYEGKEFRIDHISCRALSLVLFIIVFPRFVIGVWLGLAGTLYLISSQSMVDLILNCIALTFILDMDELLFNYVPKRIAYKLSMIRPISFHGLGSCTKVCALDLGRLSSLCVLLLIIPEMLAAYYLHMEPLWHNLRLAHTILCGGDANRVFAIDKSNSVVSYSITAAEQVPLSPDYMSVAIMQTIGLHREPDLAEYLKSWPQPSTEYANLVSLETLDTFNKQTWHLAELEQSCLNLDYDEPSRAALSALTGMDWCNDTDGYDLQGRCNEPVVRRYCPETCFCNAASWWYDRRGCPTDCVNPYEMNLADYLYKHVYHFRGCGDGRGQGLPGMAPRGGNLSLIAWHVNRELMHHGKLDKSGNPVGSWRSVMERKSMGQCSYRDDARLDIVEIVSKALHADLREQLVPTSARSCASMELIDSLFGLDLCGDNVSVRWRTDIARNIVAYCPDSCRRCPFKDYSALASKTIMDYIYYDDDTGTETFKMHDFVKSFLACGYEWIFCGETRNGTTIGASDSLGDFGSDKIYRFKAQTGKFYSFKVKALEVGKVPTLMKFMIFDYQLRLLVQNLIHKARPSSWAGSSDAEWLNAKFDKSGVYYLAVEAADNWRTANFQVSIETNESSCGRAIPQPIHCGEALIAGLVSGDAMVPGSEFDVTGSDSVPERIFRFQAEVGVEYIFDSCGSSMATQLHLYDWYLRDPALIKEQHSSSQTCEESDRGHLSKRFEVPGEYHVVVEPWSDTQWWDKWWDDDYLESKAGNIRLTMQCK